LIEAALVELSTNDLDQLGVELGALDIADGKFTRPFGFTHYGISDFQDTNGDDLPDTRLPDFENPLQGFTGGIISSDDFAIPILINAIAQDTHSNILSLPSIVVNNNENALVKSEENRPTTQTTQGTSTTQTGVGQPRVAGIELNISPSISTNDYLRLNIDINVSRFVGQADPTTGGITISRQVKTQVTLPSGSTVVLGGIIEDQQTTSKSGIPYLPPPHRRLEVARRSARDARRPRRDHRGTRPLRRLRTAAPRATGNRAEDHRRQDPHRPAPALGHRLRQRRAQARRR
ncbi:MAG: hypothetical protein HZB39_05375, partial [Planctomycetes bacterium]|nr:hypothetical protein [Planctomycetota bacterium]